MFLNVAAHKRIHAKALPTLAVFVAFLLLSVLFYQLAMKAPYNHDEEQYIFAGLLATEMNPYDDFVYLQTPYYPLALGLIYSFIDGNYYYAARLLSFFFSLGSCVVIFLLGRRLAGGSLAAAVVTALFATSTTMIGTFGSARNDMMPCFFALLGVLLVYEARRGSARRAPLHGLAGVALAVAACSKISYAFVPAVVFVYVLVCHQGIRFSARLRSDVVPLAGGGVVGALALGVYAASAWDAFLYQVLEYHLSATPAWYELNQRASALARTNQVAAIMIHLFRDTTLVAMCFIATVVLWTGSRQELALLWRNLARRDGALVLALMILSVPFVLAPRPSHSQYFQPLIPYLMLSVAALHGAAGSAGAQARRTLLVALAIVACLPGLAQLLITFKRPSTVADIHATAEEVRQILDEAGLDGKVATLSPIRVIDAGTPVYREFAAGPFLFRTGDLLSSEQLRRWHAVAPKTLHELFADDPPAAILTGYEDNWQVIADAPLEAYARRCGYQRVEDRLRDDGRLFIRTDDRCTAARP
jgi:4-amino-4-deoxy-L-arabinose transferase-like glycosyltransferase